jgi:hypothetical protein
LELLKLQIEAGRGVAKLGWKYVVTTEITADCVISFPRLLCHLLPPDVASSL